MFLRRSGVSALPIGDRANADVCSISQILLRKLFSSAPCSDAFSKFNVHGCIKSYSTSNVKNDSTDPMVTSPAQMVDRKERPKGPTLYIDDIERKAIIFRMDERGVSRADLARACNVRPSAITLLLKPFKPGEKRRGCRFLAKLQADLGLADTTKRRPSAIPLEAMRRTEDILKAFGDDAAALENWLSNGEFLTSKG